MTCDASIRRRTIVHRSSSRDILTSRYEIRLLNVASVRIPLASARALDFRIAIFARESIPKLIIGIPLGDVAVSFRRFVSTQGLERTFAEAIEINVCPALLETRAGLQYLQPR